MEVYIYTLCTLRLCTYRSVYISRIHTHTLSLSLFWIKAWQREFFSGIDLNWKQVPGLRLSHQILFVALTEGCTAPWHQEEFVTLTKHRAKHTLKTDGLSHIGLVSYLLRLKVLRAK